MNAIGVLSRTECRELLGDRGVGRAVYTEHGLPAVATLNYAVAGDRLYFRAETDTALARCAADAVLAFNVDSVVPQQRSGWSVTVTGRSRRVPAQDREAVANLLESWAPGLREDVFALDLAHVVGRWLGALPAPLAEAGVTR